MGRDDGMTGPNTGDVTGERLDVGFVPVECPGADGTGAVHTSTLLIEHLSWYHDLTVYVTTQWEAERPLPADDRVEYVINDGLSSLPHPLSEKVKALETETEALERHDLVHSYSSAFIPVLADLEVPTLSTLNSYLPVCPKADMLYHGEEKCSGPGRAKCLRCIVSTAAGRWQGVDSELRSGYVSVGSIPFVERSMAAASGVDAYHALSPHLVRDYGALGFPEDRITVIPHFYDERFFSPVREYTNPIYREEPISLLTVGALSDIKDVDTVIEALAESRARGHDVELRVAGKGGREESLRSLADDLGVADAIEWLGYVDHARLPDVYDEADVFVYSGILDEPFGRVMLEALASHTPILTSDVGSMREIVGPAGEVYQPGNPVGLADAFETLMSEYVARQRAIPDHVRGFSPDVVIDSYLALYEEVAALRTTVSP